MAARLQAPRINAITSAYGKDKSSFETWIKDKKLLRYVNKEARNRSARWLQLPGDSKFRAHTILIEKDFSSEELGRIVSQQPSVDNPHLRPCWAVSKMRFFERAK
jgi:hypothetical protein